MNVIRAFADLTRHNLDFSFHTCGHYIVLVSIRIIQWNTRMLFLAHMLVILD